MPTEVLPRADPVPETRLQPPYHVVLLNDDDHTFDYVIRMLGRLFGHGREKAFAMALEVHTSGRVIVYTGSLEEAEFKRDQIHAYGKDGLVERCAGSMSAVVEPAEG